MVGRFALPDLSLVNPRTSVVTSGNRTFVTQWPALTTNGADPVSAVLMHNNVYNEFILDSGTKSGTDWVVTMPTKRYYYQGGQILDAAEPLDVDLAVAAVAALRASRLHEAAALVDAQRLRVHAGELGCDRDDVDRLAARVHDQTSDRSWDRRWPCP